MVVIRAKSTLIMTNCFKGGVYMIRYKTNVIRHTLSVTTYTLLKAMLGWTGTCHSRSTTQTNQINLESRLWGVWIRKWIKRWFWNLHWQATRVLEKGEKYDIVIKHISLPRGVTVCMAMIIIIACSVPGPPQLQDIGMWDCVTTTRVHLKTERTKLPKG